MKKNQVDVMFILVHYHAPELTLRALESIDQHKSKFAYRSIVVDNASTDSERRVLSEGLKTLKHTVQLTKRLSNPGYAGAINFAASKKNDVTYIAILNNDAELLPDWLDKLVEALEFDSSLGIVGGIEVDDAGVSHLPPQLVLKNLTTVERHKSEDIESVEFVSGSNMLIRNQYFQEWYDSYFLYYEDVAACLNMWRSGYGVVLVNSARVHHQPNTTTSSSIPLRRGIYANRNRYRLGYQFLTNKELLILWLNGVKGDFVGSILWIVLLPVISLYKKSRAHSYSFRDNWNRLLGRLGGFLSALLHMQEFLKERQSIYSKSWSLAQLLSKLHN